MPRTLPLWGGLGSRLLVPDALIPLAPSAHHGQPWVKQNAGCLDGVHDSCCSTFTTNYSSQFQNAFPWSNAFPVLFQVPNTLLSMFCHP
jgi:hypothetical protein